MARRCAAGAPEDALGPRDSGGAKRRRGALQGLRGSQSPEQTDGSDLPKVQIPYVLFPPSEVGYRGF